VSDPRISRLKRLRRQRGWNFPGLGGFGAVEVAGFDPVGQVFGTTVAYLSVLGPYGPSRCFVSGSKTRVSPHNPLAEQLNARWKVALERAVTECQTLGGDGIIGMRMDSTSFFTNTSEFTVAGTAMRARSLTRPEAPFTTHVSGQDLARLLRSGWMPFALVFGISVAAIHFDDSMFQQTRRGIGAVGNREVVGYTQLVNDARREARRSLESAVRDQGGEGAVVGDMSLRFFERPCPNFDQLADYVVEATIVGSALVAFERSQPMARRAPLAIMRLDRKAEGTIEPERGSHAGASLGDRAIAYWTAKSAAQATTSDDASTED
jgi:uncharacterized protein YbjQ (UPF0145 family)